MRVPPPKSTTLSVGLGQFISYNPRDASAARHVPRNVPLVNVPFG